MSWYDRPNYNGVWVSGTSTGVLAHVRRAGTQGDILAQMITDPLITHADAARQRGISILGNTGRVVKISLDLPVLPETGIIPPGKFVRYTDNGVSRIGLTRGVSATTSGVTVRQQIEIESHV